MKHRACPKCGSTKIIESLVGYPLYIGMEEIYKDGNSAECYECKWTGIVHDLVEEQ
jgi:hypothetical protein